jgi:hypothetical protein
MRQLHGGYVILGMCNVCTHEISGFNADLASFFIVSQRHSRFLTTQSAMLITLGYSLVYLAEANSYCMLHLYVKCF